ncbi:MAG: GDP-mannose 4,6-dehydratase [Sphingobacteriaceae bacterium]|nr:GDP-mannose 4,6-dehydratase [Sphingobacteriaceae bacterium]
MENVIIFGINGQDGYYLKTLLNSMDLNVIGVSRSKGDWVQGDVSDYGFVENLIKLNKPSYVFHLAANSTTHHDALWQNHAAISTGTLNILETTRLYSLNTRVFISGSAVQFENSGVSISEKTPFAPINPYAVSRIHSVMAARYYKNTFGLKAYVGYFFNHDSPLRTERHVNQKIALAVQRIAKGSDEKIELGDISVKKEFNFAGDMMDAIWLLVNQTKVYEAVIGSGVSYSIEDWLDCCFGLMKKDWKNFVVLKESFKAEYKNLISDPSLIKELGWKPKVDISKLAELMIK